MQSGQKTPSHGRYVVDFILNAQSLPLLSGSTNFKEQTNEPFQEISLRAIKLCSRKTNKSDRKAKYAFDVVLEYQKVQIICSLKQHINEVSSINYVIIEGEFGIL